jgi:hypothetical protein
MAKGRALPVYRPKVNTTREAVLPACDLTLADGGKLAYRGLSEPIDAGGGTWIRLARWVDADGLMVIASLDPLPHQSVTSKRRFLHVSISHGDRYPTWDEMAAVCDRLFGRDVDVAMIRPRPSDYVNLHTYCFHWWEMPVEWGLR